MLARVSAALLAVACALPSPVAAQQLPRLRVTAFALRTDAASPAVAIPFHLIVSIHVRPSVTSLDGVVLPMLGTLEILGDEKRLTASSSGTDYRETLTVVAHAPGAVTIGAAYLDAIDTRDGKPKRFLSNDVTLDVAGVPKEGATRSTLVRGGAWFAGLLAGIAGVVVLAWAVLARRSEEPIVPPAFAEPVEPSQLAEEESVYHCMLADLNSDPTRAAAKRARERLWAAVGASQYETLADVLRRPPAYDPATRAVLRALERAAFTHDDDLPDAIRDAITALENKALP